MGITLQPHNDEHFHLRHQALWFVVLLIVMLLLLSKNVATTIDDGRSTRRSSVRHRIQQDVDPDRVAFH